MAAHAAERQPVNDAAFDAAQAAGLPVLVGAAASWCPTCRTQKPHVDAMATDPRLKEAVFFAVDFDRLNDVLQCPVVRSQSTLIACKGREEHARGTGINDPVQIRDLLQAL